MEKDKRVLPLLGTETMIVKDIEFNEEHTSLGALPRARVELEYWGASSYEMLYPQRVCFTLTGPRACDAAKLYKKGDVMRCCCDLFVATKN